MKLTILALGLFSTSVFATHYCDGKVNNLAISSHGNVHANIGTLGEGHTICNVNHKVGDFSPESCKAMYSLLLSAEASQKNLRVYFKNDSDKSCKKSSWKSLPSSAYGLYYIRMSR